MAKRDLTWRQRLYLIWGILRGSYYPIVWAKSGGKWNPVLAPKKGKKW